MNGPADAEIEQALGGVPPERWRELWDAAAGLDPRTDHAVWEGGEQVATTLVDGVERPVVRAPYVEYSPELERVRDALRGVGAVVVFGWMDWDGRQRLRGPTALDAAPVADAVRMVTAILRSERFAEGSLAGSLVDGTLPAALRRLRRWHDEREA